MRKFLSTLLALAMLLSMVPMVSVSAESETTWTKVASLADISESDTFAITITVGGNTYVLPVVAAGRPRNLPLFRRSRELSTEIR